MGIVPAAREKLKSTFLAAYLSRMYTAELNASGDVLVANSAVAHAAEDEADSTLNVAMPELSAEYWCTFIPAGQAPVFCVAFPEWAVYTSLTAYDTRGLPIASLNHRQAPTDPRAHALGPKVGDSAERGRPPPWTVNLMHGAPPWSGPLCVLFRVYRPPNVRLTPPRDRPACRLVPAARVDAEQARLGGRARRARVNQLPTLASAFFDWGDEDGGVGYQPAGFWGDESDDEHDHGDSRAAAEADAVDSAWLPQASTEAAFATGRRLGVDFQGAIQGKIKALGSEKFGSQFFHPSSVAGLFVNASATYVVAFLPGRLPAASLAASPSGRAPADGAECYGMKLSFCVPPHAPWRPFFGAMAVSYGTTATTAALDAAQLGGWGREVVLFAAHTASDASRFGGYDPLQPSHRLLTWRRCATPGLVLRFLHHCGGPDEGLTVADAAAAVEERQRLTAMNGTRTQLEAHCVPGVAQIEYF
jgi:hypothetical protein